VSYSVKSQHYVKHTDFQYKDLENYGKDWMRNKIIYQEAINDLGDIYTYLITAGIPHYIAREVLPNACLTDMYITTNVREWRYIINFRITKNNTPEIQKWAEQILILFYGAMPELFQDLMDKHIGPWK